MHTLVTDYGTLVPQHTTDDLRKKELLEVRYHANGAPRTVPLETQTSIPTHVGDIPAELITFHENGNINRIFPLNGKLSAYWDEADEAALAKPMTLSTPAGDITARFISIGFHDDKSLRSVTFWPGETISISTPAGSLKARIGVSFGKDGSVTSVEPAAPTPVDTPLGSITAFDPDALGVNGDVNSLRFDAEGNVSAVTTTLSRISVIHPDGKTSSFTPEDRDSYCDENGREPIPMTVEFDDKFIRIGNNPKAAPTRIPKDGHVFFSEPHLPQFDFKLTAGCSL